MAFMYFLWSCIGILVYDLKYKVVMHGCSDGLGVHLPAILCIYVRPFAVSVMRMLMKFGFHFPL